MYQGFRYPVLLFEVARNPSEDVLLKRLRELFRHTPEVQYVPAFQIKYLTLAQTPTGRHGGAVSLWSTTRLTDDSVEVTTVVNNQAFRDSHGHALPGNLVLPFENLVPPPERSNLPDAAREAQLRISFATLADHLEFAEQEQQITDNDLQWQREPWRR